MPKIVRVISEEEGTPPDFVKSFAHFLREGGGGLGALTRAEPKDLVKVIASLFYSLKTSSLTELQSCLQNSPRLHQVIVTLNIH